MMIKNLLCPIIISVIILGVSQPVLAQFPGESGLQNPLKADSFGKLIQDISGIVIKIGSALAVVFIIWSGFLFVTARGNEEQLKKAKMTFTWTIIGAVVLLGAAVIAEAVVNFAKGL
ncbi:pilin [Patescibacteria group bacterium]|nr:pilin [Patescibacteria group bacterium]